MKRKSTIIIGIVTMLFSHLAHCEAGWTDYVTVAELVPTSLHYYKFKLPVKKNPSGCKQMNWFYQNYSSHGSDKMFDSLLEGIKARLRLRVYVTGICNLDGYSEISSIAIIPK